MTTDSGTSTAAAPAAAPETALDAAWQQRITAFATAINVDASKINDALTPLVGTPSDMALDILSDQQAVMDSDLQQALVTGLSVPVGVFRKHLQILRGPQIGASSDNLVSTGFTVLPDVPTDQSFIDMLKIGGVLKVDTTEILAAVKAGLANRLGLYDLPDTILTRMEEFAEQQEEPNGESFYRLQKLVTSRAYGDVLSALGVQGQFVSPRRKKDLFTKVDGRLWNTLAGFQNQLSAWTKAWGEGLNSPAMLVGLLTRASGGAPMLPPNMTQMPQTTGLRDAAEGVIQQINKIFAGAGIPVARALAYDAMRIKEVLRDPSLPAAIGAVNHEQMLKALGVGVTSDYVRLEQNLSRYVLGVTSLPNVPTGNSEYQYLAELVQLGAEIPWDTLIAPTTTHGRNGNSRRSEQADHDRY